MLGVFGCSYGGGGGEGGVDLPSRASSTLSGCISGEDVALWNYRIGRLTFRRAGLQVYSLVTHVLFQVWIEDLPQPSRRTNAKPPIPLLSRRQPSVHTHTPYRYEGLPYRGARSKLETGDLLGADEGGKDIH